jgi:NADPH:quinone reductase-like Zn-dependent oxidoreductase
MGAREGSNQARRALPGVVQNRVTLGGSLRYCCWHAPDKLRQAVEELCQWYAAGKVKPYVTQCLAVVARMAAIRLLTNRQAYGKVVVMPALPAN